MYRMLMSAAAAAALLVSAAGCSPTSPVQAQPVAPGVVAVEAPRATYYVAPPTPPVVPAVEEYSQPLPHYAMLAGGPGYYHHRRHCHCYGYHHRQVHHYRHHRHHYHCAAAAQADAGGIVDGACST